MLMGFAYHFAKKDARPYEFSAEVHVVLGVKRVYDLLNGDLWRTKAHAVVMRHHVPHDATIDFLDAKKKGLFDSENGHESAAGVWGHFYALCGRILQRVGP